MKRAHKGNCRRCHVLQTAANSYIHRGRGYFQSYCISCGKIIGDWTRADQRAKRLQAWLTRYYEERDKRQRIL